MPSFEKEIENFKKGLPNSWDAFPDIDLYMDQVISYLARQPITSREDEKLTPSMINNYIKEGILPRANGKRYGREHLAYLTMIVRLKQVLSVKDTGELIKSGTEKESTEDFYSEFIKVFGRSGREVVSELQNENNDDLVKLALYLAVNSYFNKIACEYIIDIIRRENSEKEKNNKDKEKKDRKDSKDKEKKEKTKDGKDKKEKNKKEEK